MDEVATSKGPMAEVDVRKQRCWMVSRKFIAPVGHAQVFLGGGFKYFLCSPLFGEMIKFD